ncbi:unnamed protein product [Paramecium pentaurelia]|uniref:Uncharacterized protein n=1 Tax=Paramecium pentaurelia TaxID=43138 RepID=A0A8S1XSY9_9CILI|nr:unnamed protein product [Paramecium pentaurelia]
MKIIVFLIVLFAIGSTTQRLNPSGLECNKYLEKFGTANNSDGSGATKLAFSGDVYFIPGTANLKVNLRYSDVDLFNDPKYFGLVQEDGKSAEETCLDLKLFKYTSNLYADGVEVTDLKITPSNNFQKQWRYYSFIIPGAEFSTRLVQTTNSNQFLYKGYYAIAYYAANSIQLQYTFYFEFTAIVDRNTGLSEAAFKPLSRKATATCNPFEQCDPNGDSILKWCKDLTCTSFETPDLHLNDIFVLQQVMNTADKDEYYLVDTEVWYSGDGILKQATPLSVINNVKGQVIVQLKAEVVWNNVNVQVSSILSTSLTQGRRLLTQVTYDTFTGLTQQIKCIKAEQTETCPSCEQECETNGFAHDGCEACSQSNLIPLLILISWLFIVI